MTAFNITESIRAIHRRLEVQLRERRQIPHPTLKGDEGELLWLNVLRDHLPRRYAVRRGIVVDSRGQRSDQLDLIVYDPQYTPVFLAMDEHAYVLAEAVYAVFEVKYELNAANIRYAADKAASLRRLHRTNGPVVHAAGVVRTPKEPFAQLAGLLTLSHPWSEERFAEKAREHTEAQDGRRALDLVLCLEGGLIESGAPDKASSGPDSTNFVAFLVALLRRLQAMATVPAVDWTAYAASLQREGPDNGGGA